MNANDVWSLLEVLLVKEFAARVFKPAAMSVCKCCHSEGHHVTDQECPAQTSVEMSNDVETFKGGGCELSNLHKCPEGCVIADRGTTFETSEHHYQFKKLKFHDKGVEAFKMLMAEDSFKAMKLAKKAVPLDEESEAWKATAKEEMLLSNRLKYASCIHAQDKLLNSKLILVEVTGDPF